MRYGEQRVHDPRKVPSGLPLSLSLPNTPAEELRALKPYEKFIPRNPLFDSPSFSFPSRLPLPLLRKDIEGDCFNIPDA